MLSWIRNKEPALVGGLVSAALMLAVAFGADFDERQVGAISAVVVAGLALVVRSRVSAPATVETKVTQAATQAVSGVSADTAGVVGQVTDVGLQVVDDVIERVL